MSLLAFIYKQLTFSQYIRRRYKFQIWLRSHLLTFILQTIINKSILNQIPRGFNNKQIQFNTSICLFMHFLPFVQSIQHIHKQVFIQSNTNRFRRISINHYQQINTRIYNKSFQVLPFQLQSISRCFR